MRDRRTANTTQFISIMLRLDSVTFQICCSTADGKAHWQSRRHNAGSLVSSQLSNQIFARSLIDMFHLTMKTLLK